MKCVHTFYGVWVGFLLGFVLGFYRRFRRCIRTEKLEVSYIKNLGHFGHLYIFILKNPVKSILSRLLNGDQTTKNVWSFWSFRLDFWSLFGHWKEETEESIETEKNYSLSSMRKSIHFMLRRNIFCIRSKQKEQDREKQKADVFRADHSRSILPGFLNG